MTPTTIRYRNDQILEIARCQKAIIWLILVSIPGYVASLVIPMLPLLITLISLVFIFRMAVALEVYAPWLYVLFGLIPLINLVALLVINGRATTALRTHGVEVGVMGAKREGLQSLAK